MEENRFNILFVVDDGNHLVGFLTYDTIRDEADDKPIDGFVSRSTLLAHQGDPIDKAVSIIKEYGLMVLPVVDEKRHLQGVLTPGKLFEDFSELLSFGQGGFWITLNCDSLEDLGKIVEVLVREGVRIQNLISSDKRGDGSQGQEIVLKVGGVEDREILSEKLSSALA